MISFSESPMIYCEGGCDGECIADSVGSERVSFECVLQNEMCARRESLISLILLLGG